MLEEKIENAGKIAAPSSVNTPNHEIKVWQENPLCPGRRAGRSHWFIRASDYSVLRDQLQQLDDITVEAVEKWDVPSQLSDKDFRKQIDGMYAQNMPCQI